VVKTIDGVERTLGWRIPGTIFGEVPIALGSRADIAPQSRPV